jgi:hypothetical protein
MDLLTSSSLSIECCPWPPSPRTSVHSPLNFLHHSLTQPSPITLSTYTCHNDEESQLHFVLLHEDEPQQYLTAGSSSDDSVHNSTVIPLHYRVKIYGGRHLVITCYFTVCALVLWKRIYFYHPIGGWFWNCPCNMQHTECYQLNCT